jgi:predicted CxxxxCH...CXXCH cytochrome family protein
VFPNISGRHKSHNALNLVTGVCATCHNGAGIGTLNHFNQTVDVAMLASYNAKTGGPAAYVADTGAPPASRANNGGHCENVSCHGGIATPPWRTGSINPDVDCTFCHRSRTVSDQFNSYFSGSPVEGPPAFPSLHDFHINLFIGTPCTNCHDTAKLALGHYINLTTPEFELVPATTIRADVNYVGGSCTPANSGTNFSIGVCHFAPVTRSWTAP